MVLPGTLGNLTIRHKQGPHQNQLMALPGTLGNLTALLVLGRQPNLLTVWQETFSNFLAVLDPILQTLRAVPAGLGG